MLRLVTGLAALDGVICLVILLLIPSDFQSSWLLGYSRSRIMMLLATIIGICIFFGLSFWLSYQSQQAIKFSGKVEAILQKERLSSIIVGFFITLFILALIYLTFAYSNLDYRVPSDAITVMEQVKAYMYRLAPFVLWILLLSVQIIVTLTLAEYTDKETVYRVTQILSIIICPFLLAVFWGFRMIDPYYYITITKEDNLVEWVTVFFFLLTAFFSFYLAFKDRKPSRWFYLLFSVACILFALEEISWGQRIFGLESTKFFVENSDQQEINVHNVINEWFSLRTKHVAAFLLFAYGAVLPITALNSRVRVLTRKIGILVPPLALAPGFALASSLTVDLFFTGQDEEVAELFFSLLLFLTIFFQILDPLDSDL